jgi:hypothetical protein
MSQDLTDFGVSPIGRVRQLVQTYYPDPSPTAPYAAQRQALLNIAKAAGGSGVSPWGVARAMDPILEGVGGMAGGWPGEMAMGTIGHVAIKPLVAKIMNAGQKQAIQQAIGNAYPALTGRTIAQPGVGVSGTVGQWLKDLMFGGAASAGL